MFSDQSRPLTTVFLSYASHLAETTDVHTMTGLFVEIGLINFLPGLASNHSPSDFYFLSSWDYRCEPLLPALASFFFFYEKDSSEFRLWS
jgi:hypothetical protein